MELGELEDPSKREMTADFSPAALKTDVLRALNLEEMARRSLHRAFSSALAQVHVYRPGWLLTGRFAGICEPRAATHADTRVHIPHQGPFRNSTPGAFSG